MEIFINLTKAIAELLHNDKRNHDTWTNAGIRWQKALPERCNTFLMHDLRNALDNTRAFARTIHYTRFNNIEWIANDSGDEAAAQSCYDVGWQAITQPGVRLHEWFQRVVRREFSGS